MSILQHAHPSEAHNGFLSFFLLFFCDFFPPLLFFLLCFFKFCSQPLLTLLSQLKRTLIASSILQTAEDPLDWSPPKWMSDVSDVKPLRSGCTASFKATAKQNKCIKNAFGC